MRSSKRAAVVAAIMIGAPLATAAGASATGSACPSGYTKALVYNYQDHAVNEYVCYKTPKDGVDGAKGDKGDKGAVGEPGTNGVDGADGKDSTIPGPAGTPGTNGSPGTNGKDGVDSSVPGPTGPQGPAGADGAAGAPGNDGATGATGNTGPVGPSPAVTTLTFNGDSETAASYGCSANGGVLIEVRTPSQESSEFAAVCNGYNGEQGTPGQPGANGTDGVNGKNGVNKTVIVHQDGTTTTVDGLPHTGASDAVLWSIAGFGCLAIIGGGLVLGSRKHRQL